MPPAVAAAGQPPAGVPKEKKVKKEPPPPPKQTMLNFFQRAPAPKSESNNKPLTKPVTEEEHTENPDVLVVGSKSPSSDTPQRPTAAHTPGSAEKMSSAKSPSKSVDPEGGKKEKGKGKGESVINLSLALGAEKEEDCVIVSSPSDEKGALAKEKLNEDSQAPAGSAVKDPKAGKGKAKTAMKGGKPSEKKEEASKVKGREEGSKKETVSVTLGKFFNRQETVPKKEVSQKERPKHPDGTALDLEESLLMISQFASTFSEVLGIERLTAHRLKKDLLRANPTETLSNLHVALLVCIVRAGDTPDEVRMIDTDSWPEVAREHLLEAHHDEFAQVWSHLATAEYTTLSLDQRLATLGVLVDDCLATPTIKEYVDACLAQIEVYQRDQIVDEIGEKYTKRSDQSAVLVLESFISSKEEEDKEEVVIDAEGLTERQRARAKQRAEEERAARIQEEQRAKEQRLLEVEMKKKDAEHSRKERMEERTRGLLVCGESVRVPSTWTSEQGTSYQYLVMDCNEQKRQVLCRTGSLEGADTKPVWTVIGAGGELDKVIEHWSPIYPENNRHFQKSLRELVQPVMADLQKELEEKAAKEEAEKRKREEREEKEKKRKMKEAERLAKRARKMGGEGQEAIEIVDDDSMDSDGDKKKEEEHADIDGSSKEGAAVCEAETTEGDAGAKHDYGEKEGSAEADKAEKEEKEEENEEKEEEDPVAVVFKRAREVVVEMEVRTPEDMFADHNEWKGKRQEWYGGVLESTQTAGLAESVSAFAAALKKGKMQEGWDEVRVTWKNDISAVKTCAALMYLVKQLKVYIGREKARPVKLAPLFSQRFTRSNTKILDEGCSSSSPCTPSSSTNPKSSRQRTDVPKSELRRSSRSRVPVVQYKDDDEDEDDEDSGGEEVHEDDSDFDIEEDESPPAKRTRTSGSSSSAAPARKSLRSNKGQIPRSTREREAPKRATRATRSSVANGTYAESSMSEDSDE